MATTSWFGVSTGKPVATAGTSRVSSTSNAIFMFCNRLTAAPNEPGDDLRQALGIGHLPLLDARQAAFGNAYVSRQQPAFDIELLLVGCDSAAEVGHVLSAPCSRTAAIALPIFLFRSTSAGSTYFGLVSCIELNHWRSRLSSSLLKYI